MRALLAVGLGMIVLTPAVAGAQQTSAQQASAKSRADTATAAEPEFSFGQMTPTADMWLYEQSIKRYSDPKAAVRRCAEFEADQRQARLAAQRGSAFRSRARRSAPRPSRAPIRRCGRPIRRTVRSGAG